MFYTQYKFYLRRTFCRR